MTVSENYLAAHVECNDRSNAGNDDGAKFIVDSINNPIGINALAAEQGWPVSGPENQPSATEMFRIYSMCSRLFNAEDEIYNPASGRLLMTNSAQWIKT